MDIHYSQTQLVLKVVLIMNELLLQKVSLISVDIFQNVLNLIHIYFIKT